MYKDIEFIFQYSRDEVIKDTIKIKNSNNNT